MKKGGTLPHTNQEINDSYENWKICAWVLAR